MTRKQVVLALGVLIIDVALARLVLFLINQSSDGLVGVGVLMGFVIVDFTQFTMRRIFSKGKNEKSVSVGGAACHRS